MKELIEKIHSNDINGFIHTFSNLKNEDKYQVLREKFNAGNTLLHLAAEYGRLQVVSYLLGLEVPMDIKNDLQKTAFDVAREKGHTEIATLLATRIDWSERYRNGVPLNRTLSLIKDSHQAISGGKDKQLVLTLGETGVGKTTLINYFNGAVYQPEGIAGYNLRAVLVSGQEIARVGHNPMVSETLYPQVLRVSSNGVVLDVADLAGINGTREPEIELAGTLSTHLLAKLSAGVKSILFVVDVNSLNSGRGGPFRKTINTLSKILRGDFTGEASRSVYFAITKLPAGVTVNDIINRYILPLQQQLEKHIATDGASQEDKDLYQTIELMLNAKERIFIPNIFDKGESREKILTVISKNNFVISRDCLDLLHMDKHQENFISMLTFLSGEYINRSQEIFQVLPARIEKLKNSIEDNRKNINNWQNEINELQRAQEGMTPARARQMIAERQTKLRAIEHQLEENKVKRVQIQTRISSSREIINELDTDIPIHYGNPYRFQHVGELTVSPGNNPNWFQSLWGKKGTPPKVEKKAGSGSYVFENGNNLTPGAILDLDCNNQGGCFGQSQINSNKFTISYQYPLGDSVYAQVITKLAKRDIPENKVRILHHRKQIDTSTRRLQELEKEIAALTQQRDVIITEINNLQMQGIESAALVESLKTQIQQRKEWIENANKLIMSCEDSERAVERQTSQLKLQLQVNSDVFKTMYEIICILGVDNLKNEVLHDFIQEYSKQNQLVTQVQGHSPRFFTQRERVQERQPVIETRHTFNP